MVVASLVPLNSTMIAVALPDIADDLDVGRGTVAVLVTAYLAAMLVCQPFAGWLGDRWSRAHMMTIFFIGIGVLATLLLMWYTPKMAGFWALLAVIAAALLIQGPYRPRLRVIADRRHAA